jgi:hypothetical protein
MTDTDRLLGEFIDAWVAGRRPDAATYLDRARPEDREALEEGIVAFLDATPVPRYGEDELRRLREDPAVQSLASTTSWSAVLRRLRSRAGVDNPALARSLGRDLGWDEAGARKARTYLDDLDAERRPADRVSRRVLDALACALRVPRATLEAAASGLRPSPQLLWRAEDPAQGAVARHLDVLTAALRVEPADDQDDVDRAFTGGRDA